MPSEMLRLKITVEEYDRQHYQMVRQLVSDLIALKVHRRFRLTRRLENRSRLDSEKIEETEMHDLKNKISSIVDSNFRLDADYIQSQQWSAVPVESGSHFDDADMNRLASAIGKSGAQRLNAFLLENIRDVPEHLVLEASVDGLQEFNRTCAHFNFAICPDDLSFLVICTTYDYFVIAGSRDFVESALGTAISTARDRFDDFASDEGDEEPTSVLHQIASRYKEASLS
ncbi:MAG: hypothetical protein DWQ35_01430 [Planctomycetota bacterium]|nr:MAG: hypothetical protein DWQ35_01430 [Planctomycetota bacterium]